MISRETIDKIFDAARIEEVIGDFVTLKKSGSNLKGLSPFANEKTPSFMVSPAKQIFKDFSSGKGGTVVSFLMEHEQYTYPEALRYLAKKYNIEVEEDRQTDEEKQKRDALESLYLVNEFAGNYFEKQLWETDNGRNIGLSYFKERGFTEETIKKFKLGYSPDSYEAFSQAAIKENYQLDFIEKVGLVKIDGARKTDRFRGRVMFPIQSHTGRILGFGGRTLKKDAKVAKYLNSPESEIYHKSKIVYGIYQAKAEISKADECFLVEGYTDVISLFQSDIQNVVASSGTALTVDQINLIKRYTRNITLLYDGDPAGIKASLRGIDLILEQGMNVSVVLFPDGEDPDSYSKSVSNIELKDYLKDERKNFLVFKADLLLKDAGDNPLEKSKAAREMVQSIALINNTLERNAYVQETASILGIAERILFSELDQVRSTKAAEEYKKQKREEQKQKAENAMEVVDSPLESNQNLAPLYEQERALCWLLLNYGDKVFEFESSDEETFKEPIAIYILTELDADDLQFETPQFKTIADSFSIAYNEREEILKPDYFLKSGKRELMHTVVDLITDEPELHDWSKKKIFLPKKDSFVPRYTTESILRFKERKISLLIKNIQNQVKTHGEEKAEEIEKLMRLTQLRNKINEALNRIL